MTFLLAEQNTNIALRYADFGYILENGRVVMEGAAEDLRNNEDVKEFYLGLSSVRPQVVQGHQALPPPQALALVSLQCGTHGGVVGKLVCMKQTAPASALPCVPTLQARAVEVPVLAALADCVATCGRPFGDCRGRLNKNGEK